MKNLFLIVSKKAILIWLSVIICLAAAITIFAVKTTFSPKALYTIVIDAGHGGRDGGAVGRQTGVTESELNLKYALRLKELCADYGIDAIMTRSDMNGLYDESAPNKKKSEMERRKSIINSSGADIMISLHMNAFPLPSSNGAFVFYAKGSDEGYELAKSVQGSLCQSFDNAREYVSVGDYFVLNCASMPSVLVECGFLSNPQEESNLISDDYCQEFCYSLLAGILSYFKM